MTKARAPKRAVEPRADPEHRVGVARIGSRFFWAIVVGADSALADAAMPRVRGYRLVRHGWSATVEAAATAVQRATAAAGLASAAAAIPLDAPLARIVRKSLDEARPRPAIRNASRLGSTPVGSAPRGVTEQAKPASRGAAKTTRHPATPAPRDADRKRKIAPRKPRADVAKPKVRPLRTRPVIPAPPPDPVADARRQLGLSASYASADVHAAFRRLARAAHPDHGGSDEAMRRLIVARDAALQALRASAPPQGDRS